MPAFPWAALDQPTATEVNNAILGGGHVVGLAVPASRYFALTSNNNGSSLIGATLGTEYAIGVRIAPVTIQSLRIKVSTAGAASSVLRIGLRPITTAGIGAPVVDAPVPLDATGDITYSVSATLAGSYALSWTRIGDTGDLSRCERSPISVTTWVFPLATSTAVPAGGHGPTVGILNTGVTGALPSSVTPGSVVTNLEQNFPAITLRAAA